MLIHYFIGFTEIISGIIALIVSAFAYRSYRVAKENFLLFLGLSFSLIGIGASMRGISLIFLSRGTLQLAIMCSILNIIAKIVAYFILALMYTIQFKAMFMFVPLTPLILRRLLVHPSSDILSIFLLSYIVFHLLLALINKRSSLTAFVFSSFCCILISHIISLINYYRFSVVAFIVSSGIQMFGFILLLIMLVSIIK